jgi:ketosteroid isomerase-like protein
MSRGLSNSCLPRVFRGCLLLFVPVLALGSPVAAVAQHHHVPKLAREQIQTLEEQWKDATTTGDAGAMDKLLSDDYVGISWTGQVNTKAMQLDRIRNRAVTVQHMTLSDIKIKVVGPVAIVTSRATVQGTSDGKDINGDFRYTRIYQRLPTGAWQITNFEATRIPSGERPHHHEAPTAQQPPIAPDSSITQKTPH